MNYTLRHTTRYHYSAPVTLCHSEARVLPRRTPHQQCGASELQISPAPQVQMERRDVFGNRVLYFAMEDVHQTLDVTVVTPLSTQPLAALPTSSTTWEQAAQQLGQNKSFDIQLYRLDSPFIRRNDELASFAHSCFTPGRPIVEAALALNELIYKTFEYDPSFTTLATPLSEVLANRRGVCQDFAHLAIGALRSVGLAARYVSGYLETQPPPGQARLIGADASHAWLATWIPEWGWLALDPTNGTVAGEQHPVLAWGRDYADVAPLKGVMNGGGEHRLEVEVDVMPLAG
ncbi:transglutaminase family protein [Vreelandella neptunia]|uniref:Transglutaminase family protein n=1 Tax=Vreelandella neptunia TaxID=115551 RepID=A0ABZ0YHS0_9GAMM|nr:transglutaminase family protein [Halomonas neptunia]MDN3561147.1 transglutaminase family protein [Halomonas neptunia]TDW00251.1 transglutaminase-like putative cysteine protease [Halomonas alkaliantarctica]WQH11283.1 transglutaminase family protein [Halomonas neptunia]